MQNATKKLANFTAKELQLSELASQHAIIYQWFASLLAAELTLPQIQAYIAGDAKLLLQQLAQETQLIQQIQVFNQAITTLSLLTDPKLELAADFASLFLSDARHGAAPYASIYQDKNTFNGPAAQRMHQRLIKSGFAVTAEFKEPADHLALMLDYLAEQYRLLAQQPCQVLATSLHCFVQQELNNWLPLWQQQAININTASKFYPVLIGIITTYCALNLTIQ